ncbi:inactive peptidyl-prolyl cis-trans isomerase shutdown-like [Trichoplusia ni]|uniref:peptidylprolyl isomerase n=1 Tax=Trichoplusia ni TaxID=7111 RepID=A0A7E5X637_TRINI|nr:inactive peptidyl-prolyl cis-trans isomerase shutdown-like [Trichoplusia ni]
MEEVFRDPVQLTKAINIRELIEKSSGEFQIDLDFKKKQDGLMINADDDLYPDMNDDDEDDSDTEDTLKGIEQAAEKMLLSSPEYHSFEQLAPKMMDCLSNGDVKLLIIEEGDGPLVPIDAEVTLHYAAYYERADIPFDSTLTMNRGEPLRIRLGVGKVLPGLEIGLTHVKGPSARFHLLLQPAVAWGSRGALPRVKPEPVLFVISLYDVRCVDAAARFNDLPMAEQAKFEITTKTIKDIRAEAKDLFNRQKYMKAIRSYQQAMSVLSLSRPQNDAEETEIKDLKVKIYVNLAICYYKINKPKYVLGMCENIDRYVDINKHCKGIFYYGRGYELLGKIDEAISCYKKALKLEPKNKEIGKVLADLDAKNKKSAITEKFMWKKALNNVDEEKKVVFNVDDDFKDGVADMCQDLAGREDYAKFDLPMGLTKDEVACIKSLTSQFDCLVVLEDGEGKRKKVSIVKKVTN